MAAAPLDEASIFLAARQMGMAQTRRTYLEQACGGNARLRARLEALLKVHDEDKDFLAAASDEVRAIALEQVAEGPGSTIGRYRLLEVIGEGGLRQSLSGRAETSHFAQCGVEDRQAGNGHARSRCSL
jgi:hypothetical protein